VPWLVRLLIGLQFIVRVGRATDCTSAGLTLAGVASVSVGLSSRWRRFSLFGCAKIGASATLMEAAPQFSGGQKSEKCIERAESLTETLAMQARLT